MCVSISPDNIFIFIHHHGSEKYIKTTKKLQITMFELNDLCSGYLACWFILIVSRSILNVKVIRQSSGSLEKNVTKVVGATSSEDFVVTQKVFDLCICYATIFSW